MFRPASPEEIQDIDFVPQAIFNLPLEKFAQAGAKVRQGSDDLDDFKAIYFLIDENFIVLKHYRGFPPATTSLYCDINITEEEKINHILDDFF